MNGSVVAIVSAFFVIGIVVGVIAVVAMSVLRSGRPGGPRHPGGRRPPGGPADPGDPGDPMEPGGQPRWPGDVGGGFTSG